MAEIHLNTSSQPTIEVGTTRRRNVGVGDPTMPKYVGARAVVDRTEDGVRITLTDYKGTTQEIIAEAIESIVTNEDGSLTFTLPDGRTFTTDSLKGEPGTTTYSELDDLPQIEGFTVVGNKTYDELGLNGLTNLEIEALLQ